MCRVDMHTAQSCAGFCLDFVLCIWLVIAESGISERKEHNIHAHESQEFILYVLNVSYQMNKHKDIVRD